MSNSLTWKGWDLWSILQPATRGRSRCFGYMSRHVIYVFIVPGINTSSWLKIHLDMSHCLQHSRTLKHTHCPSSFLQFHSFHSEAIKHTGTHGPSVCGQIHSVSRCFLPASHWCKGCETKKLFRHITAFPIILSELKHFARSAVSRTFLNEPVCSSQSEHMEKSE